MKRNKIGQFTKKKSKAAKRKLAVKKTATGQFKILREITTRIVERRVANLGVPISQQEKLAVVTGAKEYALIIMRQTAYL